MSAERVKGPIRILCDEIGFRFDPRIERTDVLVAFVRELVDEVADRRQTAAVLAGRVGTKAPSEGSWSAINLAQHMLSETSVRGLQAGARRLHEACDRLNPDDAYPTDHLIDMLASCASAILFGLEKPCKSRHAAEAADHVWKHVYGVSRFDSETPAWSKAWACVRLQEAIISLLPPAGDRS
jgi:hypothetical protein